MKVGFVQMDCQFGEAEHNLEKARALITKKNADLIVLPELFNTGYQFLSGKEVSDLSEPVPEGPTTQGLLQIAREHRTSIVAGIAERSGNRCYNASVLLGPGGVIGIYRKIHLFYEEKKWFTPGNLPFQVYPVGYKSPKGGNLSARVGMMICFDWIFPESMRSLTLLGADIICHPANLVLPYCPEAMVTRALENHIYTITANRVGEETRGKEALKYIGKSEIVAPDGSILVRASENGDEVHVADIDAKLARNKKLNKYNDLLKDRRTELYRL